MSVSAAPKPIISVIIPTHNRPDKLVRAIRSALAQTIRSIEVLVVNDCGPDVSQVIEGVGDPRVKGFVQDRNRGPSAARNRGLAEARGTYVNYLDDDDVLEPNHLERLLVALRSSGKDFAYTGIWMVEERLGPDGVWRFDENVGQMCCPFDAELFQSRNLFPIHAVLHARSLIDRMGGFDESLGGHEDYDLWLRASRLCSFIHLPGCSAWYVKNADQTSLSVNYHSMLSTLAQVYARNPVQAESPAAASRILTARRGMLSLLERNILRAALSREMSAFQTLYERYAPVPDARPGQWELRSVG